MQTSEGKKNITRSINYEKKFSFGKIQHDIHWEEFAPVSVTTGICQMSIANLKKSHIYVISSVDKDSYPFHKVLPRIQEDTSIDIPWV